MVGNVDAVTSRVFGGLLVARDRMDVEVHKGSNNPIGKSGNAKNKLAVAFDNMDVAGKLDGFPVRIAEVEVHDRIGQRGVQGNLVRSVCRNLVIGQFHDGRKVVPRGFAPNASVVVNGKEVAFLGELTEYELSVGIPWCSISAKTARVEPVHIDIEADIEGRGRARGRLFHNNGAIGRNDVRRGGHARTAGA